MLTSWFVGWSHFPENRDPQVGPVVLITGFANNVVPVQITSMHTCCCCRIINIGLHGINQYTYRSLVMFEPSVNIRGKPHVLTRMFPPWLNALSPWQTRYILVQEESITKNAGRQFGITRVFSMCCCRVLSTVVCIPCSVYCIVQKWATVLYKACSCFHHGPQMGLCFVCEQYCCRFVMDL